MGFCYLDEKFPFLAIMFHILNLQESKVTSKKELDTGTTRLTSDAYRREGGTTHLCLGNQWCDAETLEPENSTT